MAAKVMVPTRNCHLASVKISPLCLLITLHTAELCLQAILQGAAFSYLDKWRVVSRVFKVGTVNVTVLIVELVTQ